MSVISNTTVLSNFAAIERIELLQRLFQSLFISLQVHQEIQAGLTDGYGFYRSLESHILSKAEDSWVHLTSLVSDQEISTFLYLPRHLHDGEASSLAIAQSRGWLFLTDDRAARREAKARKVPFSGTLGCLALGVERGMWPLKEANGWLHAMIRQGFYSPMSDLEPLLDR